MSEEKWDIEIKPKDKLLSVDFKELWRYRDLCSLFVKRNIITQYKQTILGPVWFVVQPALTVIMYMIVFGGIAGIPTDGVPRPLFYLAGTCLWQYFSDCITKTSNTFVDNAGIFGKVYFPRLVMPIANVISNLLRFGIQFGFFIIVYIIYFFVDPTCTAHLTWYALLFPVLILMMQCMALGLGLIVSSLTTKYRDLTNFFGVFVSLWMYATPIVYPLSYVTNPTLHKIMLFNPMTAIIETFKYGAFGAGQFSWSSLGFSAACIAILLFVGIAMFNRKQKYFIDTI